MQVLCWDGGWRGRRESRTLVGLENRRGEKISKNCGELSAWNTHELLLGLLFLKKQKMLYLTLDIMSYGFKRIIEKCNSSYKNFFHMGLFSFEDWKTREEDSQTAFISWHLLGSRPGPRSWEKMMSLRACLQRFADNGEKHCWVRSCWTAVWHNKGQPSVGNTGDARIQRCHSCTKDGAHQQWDTVRASQVWETLEC